jgi:hypothetical protein
MMNQDVIDLYDRVPGQAPILVTGGASASDMVATSGPGLAIDGGIPEGSVLLRRIN